MSGGETPNLVLKRMLELFLKVPPLKKILEFQNQKKDYETCTKTKFRTKNQTNDCKLTKWTLSIKKKQEKGAKLCANIRSELEGEKGSKTFFRVRERQNMQMQKIFEVHTDDKKTKYSMDILKSAKKNQLLLLKFLPKILT